MTSFNNKFFLSSVLILLIYMVNANGLFENKTTEQLNFNTINTSLEEAKSSGIPYPIVKTISFILKKR